jgi:hypothetical protein
VPIVNLGCHGNPFLSDLRPLAQIPGLHTLSIKNTAATDLSPLQKSSVVILKADIVLERDAAILRGMPSLKSINDRPAADFLKEMGKK